jgi:cytochrome c oxidase subunit 2
MKTKNPDLWIRTASALAAAFALSGCLTPSSGGHDDDDEYGSPPPVEHVVHVTAHRFAYEPAEIRVKRGEPVLLVLSSLDVPHGFEVPRLGLATTIQPGVETRLPFTPTEAGRFPFHCSVFCGDGHEDMSGEIDVVE